MKTPSPKTENAFTLIEILVVVGIALILAALAVPAVSRSLESGKKAQCMNNLRQIGLGLANYANENEGKTPKHWDTDSAGHEPWYDWACDGLGLASDAWRQPKGLFRCPAAKTAVPNYTMSEALKGSKVLMVTNASMRVYVADGDGASSSGINDSAPFGGLDAKRHGKGANYLFVDGHVEYLTAIPTNGLTPL